MGLDFAQILILNTFISVFKAVTSNGQLESSFIELVNQASLQCELSQCRDRKQHRKFGGFHEHARHQEYAHSLYQRPAILSLAGERAFLSYLILGRTVTKVYYTTTSPIGVSSSPRGDLFSLYPNREQ